MKATLTPKNISFPLAPAIRWEQVACNLCGGNDAEIYHRERLPYFNEMLDFSIVRCRRCGLVYTNPRLADHNATYLFASSDDPETIEAHAQAKARIFTGALNEIAAWQRRYGVDKPGALLDIGCGSGHFLEIARTRGFEIRGLEPARIPADYAAKKLSVPIINTPVSLTDLPDKSFDVITAWDVIEHVSDPQAVLRQCVQWLRPGGIMALRFPSATWQKIKGLILHQILHSPKAAFGPTMHLYFFTEQTFTWMAAAVGLEVLKTKTTPMEKNCPSPRENLLKDLSGLGIKICELLCGVRLGNLEIYCRKRD